MSLYRFANNASTTLASSLSIGATTAVLASGTGAIFPALLTGEVFTAAIIAVSGQYEIVLATALSGDTVTITRGQEGTAAATFAIGSRFEVRATATMYGNFLQRSVGGQMLGDIDMTGHAIRNATLPGPITTDDILLTSLRGADRTFIGDTANGVITFPAAKGRPKLGGNALLSYEIFTRVIFTWNGVPASKEAWWKWCDGTNGTPDLRDRFILGAIIPGTGSTPGAVGSIGKTGGLFETVTELAGDHDHSGSTVGHKLVPSEVPQLNKVSNSRQDSVSATQSLTNVTYIDNATPHAHGIVDDAGHRHDVNITPPYYRLAFVMLNPAGLL